MTTFIRFKNIPSNELSAVHDGDAGIDRYEIGVSCYQCINENGCYKIVLPSINSGATDDLNDFIHGVENNKFPVYLIEAEQVGMGTYGEPVVKNVKVLNQLSVTNLLNIPRKVKLDPTNFQLVVNQLKEKESVVMIDAKTFFNDEQFTGDVHKKLDGSFLWSRMWNEGYDASTVQAEDAAEEIVKLIHSKGYRTGVVFAQHDYSSITFWKDN